MKKKIKYLVFFFIVISAIGIIFYLNYLKSLSIISRIPADVSYCFTINKKKLTNEILFLDNFKKDTLIKAAGNNLFSTAESVINSIGINPLGEIALYGKHKSICIAWTALSKKSFYSYIKSHKLKVKQKPDYDFIKINKNYYLYFDWPLIVLSNKLPEANSVIFDKNQKKLSIDDLQNKSNMKSSVFGFIKPDSNSAFLKLLPLNEKAYVSVNIAEHNTEILIFQSKNNQPKNNFLPKISENCLLAMSCPWDTNYLNSIEKLPVEIKRTVLKIISKPVSHINFEVLDTISSTEQMITYDMDDEFKLTQKIFYKYKTFPGLYIEFFKSKEDSLNLYEEKEFFKQKLRENQKSYILQSGNKTYDSLPLNYFYANFELLRTDPFWKSYCLASINKIEMYSTPQNNGSVIKIELYY